MEKNQINILYIEDDEDHAMLFMDVLSSITHFLYKIIHKKNLTDGIKALRQQDFSLVILDLGLPESSGLETLLKMISHCTHIPIIVLTSNNDFQLGIEAIKSGAADFLTKEEVSMNSVARVILHSMERFEILNELEQKNESLNTFVLAASHDVKKPLYEILKTIDSVVVKYKDKLPEELKLALVKIRFSTSNVSNLINSLLEFSKAEARLPASGHFPASRCVSEALEICDLDAQTAHAKISVQEELPRISGNADLLIQVFHNLINNALKYVDGRPPEIFVGCAEDETEFVFHIKDNGIGIDEQYFSEVFEPLRRLKTPKRYPGHGIGLSICKRIIASHGGRIWLESSLGEGSTFYFSLPKNSSA